MRYRDLFDIFLLFHRIALGHNSYIGKPTNGARERANLAKKTVKKRHGAF